MNKREHSYSRGYRGARLVGWVLAAVVLLPEGNPMLQERQIIVIKPVEASELPAATHSPTLPPAREPEIAVQEEYRLAQQQGTARALELFIARHPDDPLADKARADLHGRPR